ncbi:hypothetical protein Trydic_g1759 [Trypoxylus dichotomus]
MIGFAYELFQKPIRIHGFGTASVETIGSFEAIDKVDQASTTTNILVIPDNYQKVSLIIGQPFTEQAHIIMARKGNDLRLFEDTGDDALKMPALPLAKVNL